MIARVIPLLGLRLRQELLEWSGTWWFLLTLVVQAVVAPLIGLFVWSAVYPGDPAIGRYYLAVAIVTLMTESFEQFSFSERVYDGTISHELLRPQPVVVGLIGTNLAIRAWLTGMGLPVLLLAGLWSGAAYDWRAVGLWLLLMPPAAALAFLWTYVLSLTAYWTERVHAIVGFGSYLTFLLGGTAAPVAVLPDPWRWIAELLPFRGMIGLPAEVAAGDLRGSGILAGLAGQGVWIAVFVAVAVLLWHRGVRRYTAVGS